MKDLFPLLFCLLVVCCPCGVCGAEGDADTPMKLRQLTTADGLPTNEVQKIYQDREGFLWFATRYGCCRYDGYGMTVFRSGMQSPGLLTNNNVLCFGDDDRCLWIGTQEGVNALDKRSGEIRRYIAPVIPNNAVSCLLVTRDDEVWIGTDAGLCRYDAERDSFLLYDERLTGGAMPAAAIKSLYEDAEDDLWIGHGQLRLGPQETRHRATDVLLPYSRVCLRDGRTYGERHPAATRRRALVRHLRRRHYDI